MDFDMDENGSCFIIIFFLLGRNVFDLMNHEKH